MESYSPCDHRQLTASNLSIITTPVLILCSTLPRPSLSSRPPFSPALDLPTPSPQIERPITGSRASPSYTLTYQIHRSRFLPLPLSSPSLVRFTSVHSFAFLPFSSSSDLHSRRTKRESLRTKMARLAVLFALCLLPAIAVAARPTRTPFSVVGRVYCDTCQAGFETPASTYIAGNRRFTGPLRLMSSSPSIFRSLF